MKQSKYPIGWDEERVRRVLEHYEQQPDEEAVAEDEAAYEAHAESEHFKAYGVGECFPHRETAERAAYETFEP